MSQLIISGGSPVASALAARCEAHDGRVDTMRLPQGDDDADTFKLHFAAPGRRYANVYVDFTDGLDEMAAFTRDAGAARIALGRRLKELLKALKYGAQHMARADGGRIWVLLYDHSVSFSVAAPSNPVTNFAAIGAVQSLAKEVAHFDVQVNLFMIHPTVEAVDARAWRAARESLHVYRLKYKPQAAAQVAELICMYTQLAHLSTTGAVIPVGSGIAVANI